MSDANHLDELLSVWDRATVKPAPEDLCASHPELLPELQRRLALLRRADGAMGVGNTQATRDIDITRDVNKSATADGIGHGGRSALPQRVGGYQILEMLGEGGMGAVYKAEQQTPRRVVALKLIKSGMFSGSARRRFELEVEVLGRLKHPGIAQVYEAGSAQTPAGPQPYFAMELVDGRRLDEYVREENPSLRRRLELMVKLCRAVEHAHQKGVVHRDLKPANILVDHDGEPKILDFGVARAVDADLQRTTLQTETGQLVGTLPYMSPEQAGGAVSDIDTRSDVYSLGVIAYQLLAGALPYNVSNKLLPEAIRAIREDEPTRLGSVDRAFRGDIETIIGKAMQKEKDRRYPSAGEFAADIERHLKSEPIGARAPSTWYQFTRFARRNKALVIAVAAAIIALSAVAIAAIVTTWQTARANQRTAVEFSRNLAQSAQMAAQRGQWETAIDLYAKAVQNHHPDPVAMNLGQVRALTNLNRLKEAQTRLADIERRHPDAVERADFLFERGDLNWATDREVATSCFRRALAKGLTPADQAYVRGMLEGKLRQARNQFAEAQRIDPFHYESLGMLTMTQVTLGEFGDAKRNADYWRQAFPSDPMAKFTRAIIAALEGDRGTAQRLGGECEAQLGQTAGKGAVVTPLIDCIYQIHDWDDAMTMPISEAVGIIARLTMLRGGVKLPTVESLKWPTSMSQIGPDILNLIPASLMRKFPRESIEHLQRSFPVGLIFLLAGIERQSRDTSAETIAAASELFQKAMDTPSPIYVKRYASILRTLCATEAEYRRNGGDWFSDKLKQILAHDLPEIEAAGGMRPWQDGHDVELATRYILNGFDEVGRRVALNWLDHDKDSVGAHYLLAVIAFRQSEYFSALNHLEKVNAKDPNYSQARDYMKASADSLGGLTVPGSKELLKPQEYLRIHFPALAAANATPGDADGAHPTTQPSTQPR